MQGIYLAKQDNLLTETLAYRKSKKTSLKINNDTKTYIWNTSDEFQPKNKRKEVGIKTELKLV